MITIPIIIFIKSLCVPLSSKYFISVLKYWIVILFYMDNDVLISQVVLFKKDYDFPTTLYHYFKFLASFAKTKLLYFQNFIQ